jgi:serine protease
VNATGGTTNLIVNGGFEAATAAPWTLTAGVLNTSASEPPHSGAKDAWLDGYGTTHTDSAVQTVTIPSTATTATLTFFLHIDTAETTTTTAFDVLTVQVLNSANTVIQTLGTFSNLNKAAGYTQRSFSLANVTGLRGQSIKIRFTGTEDSSLQTSFVIDDVALNVQ